MFNYIIALYGPFIYTIFSYISFLKNKNDYIDFFNKKDIQYVLNNIILNVYFFLPLSLFIILTIQPITLIYKSLLEEIIMIIIEITIGELWFYILHRLIHTNKLFFLHEKHHEVINPIGITALYAHPFDAIFVNIGSILLIHLIYKNSLIHNLLVGTWAIWNTIMNAHKNNSFHAYHHKTFKYNYGLNLFMDYIFNTNKIPAI